MALVAGVCYVPAYVGMQFGSFNFTAIRLLVAVGVVRMLVRREVPRDVAAGIDRAMLAWTVWLLLSSIFHEESSSAFVFRFGLAYDALGIYILARSYCRSAEAVTSICRTIALILIPLALAMLYEKAQDYNVFSILGGVGEHPMVREGHTRANGPFGHPILAGTVGGICVPIMIGL